MPEKLERCIKKVQQSAGFEKTYRNRKNKKMTREQLAWAVCRKTLKV